MTETPDGVRVAILWAVGFLSALDTRLTAATRERDTPGRIIGFPIL